ncbi:glycosyltransferase family 4 protein [Mammaliicoccus sciuri]|uniref:glycosyltransferase family 4 protein n=1 Tax=Mammaliicoccus sciuri TaxID=1296 RepID=UPI002DBC32EB|nr:glycosyltransferase family 4 protein [Mammaliicoccus sciuri]MEB7965758.1 glycosyltransferase family 4 protein [Mammaliicoccus sciuri]
MRVIQVAAIDMTHIKLLNNLNKKCLEEGIEVHCVSTSGNHVNKIKDNGFYFHNIPIARKISLISNLKSIMLMVKLFKLLKPDIVHVHTPVAAVLGRIAAKIANVPTIIYTAHGFYFHEGMSPNNYKRYYMIEKYIGRFFTDYIFTQSEEDFEVAKKGKFLPNSKKNNYLHISNGIDLDSDFNISNIDQNNIRNIKKQHNIKDTDIVVSFVGRLVKEKGIIDLLNSYKYINYNVKFIIIGSLPDSERDNDAIKIVNSFKDNKNIIFTGQIFNINEYLYISDIYCLPSYREGMPRSIIEAMAMKNAVIATNIRGSREEVLHNLSGYLVETNSSKEIAFYIDKLSKDKELMESFKEYGYKRATKFYNEKDVVAKQIDVMKKVAK